MISSSLSGSGMAQARLSEITWLKEITQVYFIFIYRVSYLRAKPSTTEPSSLTSSDVFPLYHPPMRNTPCAVDQDIWLLLLLLSVWDVRVQVPAVHLSQLVSVPMLRPPHASPPSWVWPYLPSGNSGSEQLVLDDGRNISADLRLLLPWGWIVLELYPPVIRIAEKYKQLE